MRDVLEISHDEKLNLGMRVKKMFENHKGLLAADEKPATLEKRFTKYGIGNTAEKRREFRSCLFSTKEIEKYIGGVILNEDTFEQVKDGGTSIIDTLIERNIEIGVKMDKGLTDFGGGESISVGLEDLENRIKDKRFAIASFCKWRSVLNIADGIPTDACISQNCMALCKYAMICQQNGKVPIIEPEIAMAGSYTMNEMAAAAKRIYSTLFQCANKMNLFFPGVILKCSFITDGDMCPSKTSDGIGTVNVGVLASCLPLSVGGVVYLSGGHPMDRAFELLATVHTYNTYKDLKISFSFCRALTDSVLEIWAGSHENIEKAQICFIQAVKRCSEANGRK